MIIRKATQDDVVKVAAGYAELAEHEKNTISYTNWQFDYYPTVNTAQESFKKGTLFVLEDCGEVCASMILNHVQPCEHHKIKWKYNADDAQILVIHTLCVNPSKTSRGYATAMVNFAHEFAKQTECKVIRLDTYVGNTPAQSLYKKLGYEYAGTEHVFFEGKYKDLMYFEYKV